MTKRAEELARKHGLTLVRGRNPCHDAMTDIRTDVPIPSAVAALDALAVEIIQLVDAMEPEYPRLWREDVLAAIRAHMEGKT